MQACHAARSSGSPGSGAAAGTAALGATRASGDSGGHPYNAMEHAAHTMGPVGRVDTTAFNPTTFTALVRTSRDLPDGGARAATTARRRGRTARCSANTRSSPSIARSRSRPASSFRPGRSTGRCRARRCAPPKAIASASRSSTPGSHPHTIHFHGWHPPEMDGSLPEHQVHARREVRLRVRRRAVRRAPVSLPRRPAEAAHPQGPVRHVHRRSEDAAARRRTSW